MEQVVGSGTGGAFDSLVVARMILDKVAECVGCSVRRCQMLFREGRWLHIVVMDDAFAGSVDVQALADALCGLTQGKMRYGGPVAHEGGVVTIEVIRADDGGADLYLGADQGAV